MNPDRTQATATLKSMFKFPEGRFFYHFLAIDDFSEIGKVQDNLYPLLFQGSEVHIQCDVAQCVGGCFEENCPGDVLTASAIKNGRPGNKIEDGTTPAATTVFVLDPADAPCNLIFVSFWNNFYLQSGNLVHE